MLCLFIIIVSCFLNTFGGKIKTVDEPFAFNNAAVGSSNYGQQGETPLLTRYLPSQPSGPEYLIKNLHGKCFNYLSNNYKYTLCPYNNVTQREQSYRWSAFNGILGVWKDWTIENNTFVSMHMVHGDSCSDSLDREVKVSLKCGLKEEILSVSEPSMCRYHMVFQTRFACPNDVFMVYPVLSEHGKQEWESIEYRYAGNELTRKGYEVKRLQLFMKENLKVESLERRKSVTETVAAKKSGIPVVAATKSTDNNQLEQCQQRYEDVTKELEQLRETLRKLIVRYGAGSNDLISIFSPFNKTNKQSEVKNSAAEISFESATLSDNNVSKPFPAVDRFNVNKTNDDRVMNTMKLKGDVGTVNEIENPKRLLRSRIKFEKKNHTHENERKLHLNKNSFL